MLKVEAQFPFPGSMALFDQYLWRVYQHIEGGIAVLYPAGSGGGFNRRVPIADLVDPSSAIALRPDARVGLALASALREVDIVLVVDLARLADDLLASGKLQWRPTVRQLESLLPDLGWQRDMLNHRRCWRRAPFVKTAAQNAGEAA